MTPRLRDADRLIFAVGLEDTAIGSSLRGGGLPLDEYELTGHTEQWEEDLARVEETGASALRYGFPWYRVNPAPGVFDWSWTDQVVSYLAQRKDLKVILDLVHYGTPTWLQGSFADPDFSEAISDYAKAVAERYRGLYRGLHAAERAVGHGVVLRPQGYMAALLTRGRRLGDRDRLRRERHPRRHAGCSPGGPSSRDRPRRGGPALLDERPCPGRGSSALGAPSTAADTAAPGPRGP